MEKVLNKEQLADLVDHCNALWGKECYGENLKIQRRAWWEFLHDLDFVEVKHIINRMALSRTYQPRIGEIRVEAFKISYPSAMEAWMELQNNRAAVNNGADGATMAPMTVKTVRKLGPQAMGLQTNSDRDKFIDLYERTVTQEIESLCHTVPIG